MPVQNTEYDKSRDEAGQLEHSPNRLAPVLAFQFFEDGLGILAKETDKRVFQRMFGFTIVAVLVNRNPIDRVPVVVGAVGVSLVMLHVDALVENLTKTNRDRFHNAEQAIQQRPPEIRIVNEVVGNAVDVPGNAHGIDETENQHHPERLAWEKIKHAEEISAVQNARCDRNYIPSCVRKNLGIRLRTFDGDEFVRLELDTFHSWESHDVVLSANRLRY